MNGKTAKLLNKYAIFAKVTRKSVKKLWNLCTPKQRAITRMEMKSNLLYSE